MDNHAYDIVKALTKTADGLYAFDQYLEDARGCQACKAAWTKLKQDHEKELKILKNLLASHQQSVTANMGRG